MNPARYVDALRAMTVLDAADALGIELVEHRATTSPASFACPLCAAETRHGERRRGACGIRPDGRGWSCFECGERGDAITLVCVVMFGKTSMRELTEQQRGELRDWTGCRRPMSAPKLRLVPKPPEFPPFARVAACWRSCAPVTSDRDVREWLVDHKIDAQLVARLDLARALPANDNAHDDWASAGNRLVLPLRDHAGYPRSLKARFVGHGSGDLPKSVSPGGFSAKGLAFFDHRVRAPRELWFVEGEKKFLQLVTLLGPATAIVGIGSGMYSQELVDRFRDVERAFIAPDPDVKHKAGARYASDLGRMLTAEQWASLRFYKHLAIADHEQRVFTTALPSPQPQIDDLIEAGRITNRSDLMTFMTAASEVHHARTA